MHKELENSLKQIKSKTNGKTGFTLPDNYLNDFSDRLITDGNKIVSNTNSFQVPQNYFENFDDILSKKIKENTAKKTKVIPLYQRALKTTSSIAAACLLIFAIHTHYNSGNNLLLDIHNISEDELDALYENGNFNLDNDALALALGEHNINFDDEIVSALNLSDESIETYLGTINQNTILDEIP